MRHGLAEGGQAWPRASASWMYSGTGRGSGTGQVPGSRGVSRVKTWEKVRAAASRAVSGSPRPHCSRSVAIREVCRCSCVEHLAFGHPRRDHDGRDPVARAVEREPELACRSGRVRRRHRGGRNVVVGAARFVPADQQGRVPHVGPGRGLHRLVGVVDPGQERLTAQDRRRRVDTGDHDAVAQGSGDGRVVVPVPQHQGRLDEGEVGQVPGGGIGLELGERHEVRREPVLEPGVVDQAGGREPVRLGDVDLPRLAVLLQPVEDRLGVLCASQFVDRGVHRRTPMTSRQSRTTGS